jgi:hypothetical protein
MNDIDIIVGLTDLAAKGLDKIEARVRSMSERSQSSLTQMSDAGIEQFKRLTESVSKQGLISPQAVAKLETALNGIGSKIEASVAQTNAAIESTTQKITGTISSISNFVRKAATIATVTAAFITVGKGILAANGAIASAAMGMNRVEQSATKAKTSVLGSLAPFAKYAVAAGATATLTKATIDATSATTGLTTKVMAVGRGALAAFVLRNAMKKTEDGASTLGAKLAKVASFALAFDVVARASVRFGLGLLGLKKKSDDVSTSLTKVSVTAKAIDSVKTASFAALAPMATLANRIEDLPNGAASIANMTSSLQAFGSQLGAIGFLVSVPAAIAGGFLAVVAATSKSERQLMQMTNKLALVDAAAKNISIDDVDTGPLRKIAEDAEKTARSIQGAVNVPASKLMTLATNSLARGLDPAQLGDAMKSATGLAEVFGTSLEEGMSKTRAAMEGNFESFEKIIPSLATMTTQEEKLAAVSRLASNGLKVMKMESSGLWGTVDRLKNGFGNLLADIGQGKSITELFATVLRDIVAPAVEFADSKLKSFGFDGPSIMDTATQMAAGVIATIQTIGSNWDTITTRMSLSGQLAWIQIKDGASFFVSDTLPWIGRNLFDIMANAWDRVVQKTRYAFQLMTTASMEYFGLVAKGTTEFQKEEMDRAARGQKGRPIEKAPERQASEKEKSLIAQIQKLDNKLAASFNANYDKAFQSLQTSLQTQTKATEVKLNQSANAKPVTPEPEKATVNKAQQSDAFQSRFLARGPSKDPQVEMVQILKQINAHQSRIVEAEKSKQREREARRDANIRRSAGTVELEVIA